MCISIVSSGFLQYLRLELKDIKEIFSNTTLRLTKVYCLQAVNHLNLIQIRLNVSFTLWGILTKCHQRSSFIDSLLPKVIAIAQCESSAVCCSPQLCNTGNADTVADTVNTINTYNTTTIM